MAQLTRVTADDGELSALIASGLARPPSTSLPKDFLTRKLPRTKASVQRVLLDDRSDRL